MKTALSFALAISAAFASFAHADTLKVGGMSGSEAELLEVAAKVAKEKYGLDVEVITFDDYVAPNIALIDKAIDVNAFQHQPYLETMEKERGFNLVVVGNTFIYPIGAYSKKITDISQLKDGDKIAIPNDPSNEGRSLILLDKKGLITLKDPTNLTSSTLDIKENPHNYQFIEVDAAQLPRMLDEVPLAFINTGYAIPAGLNPAKDPIIAEDKDSPYVNVIVARPDNANSKEVKEFVESYQSAPVEAFATKDFKGAAVKGW